MSFRARAGDLPWAWFLQLFKVSLPAAPGEGCRESRRKPALGLLLLYVGASYRKLIFASCSKIEVSVKVLNRTCSLKGLSGSGIKSDQTVLNCLINDPSLLTVAHVSFVGDSPPERVLKQQQKIS